jgi:hypothetical protein
MFLQAAIQTSPTLGVRRYSAHYRLKYNEFLRNSAELPEGAVTGF